MATYLSTSFCNCIIASCQPIIHRYASYYERNPDKCEDLEQELRIKLWTNLQYNYDSTRGTVYDFAYGIIHLEAKKHRLDAHKYRQSYFDNNMVNVNWDLCSCVAYDQEEDTFEKFIDEFSIQLTPKQNLILEAICNEFDDEESVFNSSGKLRSESIIKHLPWGTKDYNNYFNSFKFKLFVFAKNKRIIVRLSSSDAGF